MFRESQENVGTVADNRRTILFTIDRNSVQLTCRVGNVHFFLGGGSFDLVRVTGGG